MNQVYKQIWTLVTDGFSIKVRNHIDYRWEVWREVWYQVDSNQQLLVRARLWEEVSDSIWRMKSQ